LDRRDINVQTLLKDPKSKSDWLIAFVAVVTYLVVGNGLAPAQFVPPGCPGRWVRGVGGMTCQCPDGSFARMVGPQIICGSGQQQPGPQQSQIPPGSVSCGRRGYCPPGLKCVSGSVCVPQDAVDCGNGVFCAAGQKCSTGRCLPRDAVDCGQGLFCNPGMVCVGTAECITVEQAARRQSDAQKKAELAQDQILCVKQNSINEAIAACTRLIRSSQLTERELAHVYFLRRKAELAQDKILCAKHNSINEAIAACTRLIQSSQLTERDLAYVYFLRSMRWKAQGDVERSQDDYRESLKYDPFFQNKLSTLLELDNHGVVTFSCGERYCDAGLVCVANNCMTSQQADLAESQDAWHQRGAEYNDAVNKQQSGVTKAAYSDFTKRLGIPLIAIPIALVVLTVLLLIYRLFRNSRSSVV
jgi:hypothetical protein